MNSRSGKSRTASVIVFGLLPSLFSDGIGTDVMKSVAVPRIGGMLSAALLFLIVMPVAYAPWYGRSLPAPAEKT